MTSHTDPEAEHHSTRRHIHPIGKGHDQAPRAVTYLQTTTTHSMIPRPRLTEASTLHPSDHTTPYSQKKGSEAIALTSSARPRKFLADDEVAR